MRTTSCSAACRPRCSSQDGQMHSWTGASIPGPGPAPATAFPDYDVVTTANGMRVIVVQNHELPTVAIRLLVDRQPILEKEMAGVVDLTGQLMRSGTTKRTKDQLDEEVDRIGATLGASGTSSVDASRTLAQHGQVVRARCGRHAPSVVPADRTAEARHADPVRLEGTEERTGCHREPPAQEGPVRRQTSVR